MNDATTSAALRGATELVQRASSILFVTGAGISADSGLPTYRGVGGLYEGSDTDEGVPIERALSGEMFRQRPAITWKYIHQIERAGRGAQPNDAHRVIAQLERDKDRVFVLTQNVDGLHRAAGSRNVIEIHGNVHGLLCSACAWEQRVESYAGLGALPTCPQCGAVIRPRVVLFGEMLPDVAVRALYRELERGFDLVVSIGTSSLFPYIVMPVVEAARGGRPTVEINPATTDISDVVTHHVRLGAAVAMRAIAGAGPNLR
ncbi:MAG: NAD-dependent deacylase [Myxococcales bacterium FL481]|nr:MAG: NAD-dependent deacylase [Myxococcales bacterium FL481]